MLGLFFVMLLIIYLSDFFSGFVSEVDVLSFSVFVLDSDFSGFGSDFARPEPEGERLSVA